MRSSLSFFSLILLLLTLFSTTLAAQPRHYRRDGDSTTATIESKAASTAARSTDNAAASTSNVPSSGASTMDSTDSVRSSMTSMTISATPVPAATTELTTADPSQTANPDTPPRDRLPLEPKITPAMGIVGIVLLLAGAGYTVIGIRNKWMYIFLSAAFLTSLAVTVLIVYVMNPPVSDAVQGAFFVAAFFTGIIVGALSLIFTEVTEGLGCLLGGFCLSMWFMTLSPGGLIKSSTGKIVFIAVMTFAGFSLSFSHYTRTYGLIVCIAFGGATATILGIDCFTRAGLKEFWLYIWDLNNQDIFPLNTNTYPITRGIRVEIACTILIFLFGLVSQFKLWTLVKAHRDKQAADRLEHAESRERLESELGRKIEDDVNKERARWEQVYGEKDAAGNQADSVVGSRSSIQKGSASIHEMPTDGVELLEIKNGKEKKAGQNPNRASSITIRVAGEDDEIQAIDQDGNPIHAKPISTRNSSVSSKGHESGSESSGVHSKRSSSQSSAPAAPVVVPLPFRIPIEEDEANEDNGSTATAPETVHTGARKSKRKSLASQKRSSVFSQKVNSESMEELIVPHIEDDRASSLAATIDEDGDEFSLPALSPPASPMVGAFAEDEQNENSEVSDKAKTEANGEETKSTEGEQAASPAARKLPIPSLTISTDPPTPDKTEDKKTPTSSKRQSALDGESNAGKSAKSPKASEGSSIEGSLTNYLPSGMSKVAMSYRTNEWAKHLEVAEKPDLEEIDEPESPGVQVDTSFTEAASAEPVTNPFKQTPPISTSVKEPKKPKKSKKDRSSGNVSRSPSGAALAGTHGGQSPDPGRSASALSQRHELGRSASALSQNDLRRSSSSLSHHNGQQPQAARTNTPDLHRSSSAMSMGNKRGSNPSQLLHSGLRNSSMPILSQTLVESPVEEMPDPGRSSSRMSGAPLPGDTLLGKRESMMRSKMSSTSFGQFAASTPNVNIVAPSDVASIYDVRAGEGVGPGSMPLAEQQAEVENMTLAERRRMIQRQNSLQQRQQQAQAQQQQQPMQRSQSRQSLWTAGPALQLQNFDSHQPQRGPRMEPAKRETMLANWRESLQQPTQQVITTTADEGRRAAMLNERRQQQQRQQQQQLAASYRDSQFDSMMRRGDMLDLHKEALRKMQAAANANNS